MRPAKRGSLSSNRVDRTIELTPSAPISRSASARVSVGEAQSNAACRLLDAGQTMVEPQAVRRDDACQRFVKVAAMGQQIRRAVLRLGRGAEHHVEQDLAGLPVPVVPRARIEGLGAQHRFQPQAAQHMHGVAADLDAGAQPRELPRLLVDGDGEALLAERRRGGQSPHAGARDGDVKGALAH